MKHTRVNKKKKPYRKSRVFDLSCRCHGGCPWCRENRLIQAVKESLRADATVE